MTRAVPQNLLRLLPIAIFAVVAGFFALALSSGDPSKIPSALIGKPVPASNFTAVDGLVADGKAVPGFSNADLAKGKVSVVNFWASWCAPCIDEHPVLEELKAAAGVDVYGVNYKDDPAAARRFLGRYGNPFTAVGADSTGRTAIDWGVYGTPETFVVNGQGQIVYKHVGPLSAADIKSKILPAVEAAWQQSGKG
jgi:cytochrome c biogenesis protein CcmG, thiol:disulfide interchange protein DsbE